MTPHNSYRTLNKVLLICGCERRMFLGGVFVGLGMFLCFASVTFGVSIFALFVSLGYFHARDPVMLRVLLNLSRIPSEYDPAKRSDFVVHIYDSLGK